jgi:hypothetical protein
MESKESTRLTRLRQKHFLLKGYCTKDRLEDTLKLALADARKVKDKELAEYYKQQLKELK